MDFLLQYFKLPLGKLGALQLDDLTVGEGTRGKPLECDLKKLLHCAMFLSQWWLANCNVTALVIHSREAFARADQSYSHKNPHVHVWVLLWGLIPFVPFPPPPQHFYSRRCCWVKLAFVQPSPLRASVSLLNVLMNLAELAPQDKKRTSEKTKEKKKSKSRRHRSSNLSLVLDDSELHPRTNKLMERPP